MAVSMLVEQAHALRERAILADEQNERCRVIPKLSRKTKKNLKKLFLVTFIQALQAEWPDQVPARLTKRWKQDRWRESWQWDRALRKTVYGSLGLHWETLFGRQALLDRIKVIVKNPKLEQDFVSRLGPSCTPNNNNIRGVFGELLFWHLLTAKGVKLEPSGPCKGAPDFKAGNTYLEVTKPFISNIEDYRCRMKNTGGSLDRMYAIQQQEMTSTICNKFKNQLLRWHRDDKYKNCNFYLCLDLSDFDPCTMAGFIGGFDAVGRLLYGVGNTCVNISQSTGEADLAIESCTAITKCNNAPISVGYLNDPELSRLAGVVTVDCYGNFKLYKNRHYDTLILDDIFEREGIDIIYGPMTH